MFDFAAMPASDFELAPSFVAGMMAEHSKPASEPKLQALCPERGAGLALWALSAFLPVLLPLASCNEQWLRQNSEQPAAPARCLSKLSEREDSVRKSRACRGRFVQPSFHSD